MILRCMPNLDPWGPPGTRVMTILGIYVSAKIPDIEKFQVYGGLWTPGGSPSFFSSNFLSNGVRIMSGEPFLIPIMTIFINVTILDIRIYIYICEYIYTYINIYVSTYTLVKPYMGIYVYGDGGGAHPRPTAPTPPPPPPPPPRPRHPHIHISPYMASPGYIWIYIYIY